MPTYADLFTLSEDKRIDLIGQAVMVQRKNVDFIVEDTKKANRYIKKLRNKWPRIVVNFVGAGPIDGVVTVSLSPPAEGVN